MDLLSELLTRPVPRSDALAGAVARRLDRPLAMFGLGLLYYFVVANDVLLAGGYALYRIGRYVYGWPLPHWYIIGSAIGLIPVLWVAFLPFRWWRRRRLGAALELGRSGDVIEGEIAQWRQRGSGWHAVIWFTHAGREHALVDTSGVMRPDTKPVGAAVPVLYAPQFSRALCFSDGDGVPGQVQDGPRSDVRV